MATRKNRFGFGGGEDYPSESKKNSSQHRRESKKSDSVKVHEPEYVKSYVCPKCNNFYDFQLANNSYVGRVPLLLNCKHTICEECALVSVQKQRLECAECDAVSCFGADAATRKPQNIFPVNFYVFGLVLYYRRSRAAMPNLNFRPASADAKQPDQGPEETGCSQAACVQTASLKCLDCDEVFCDGCSRSVHGSGPASTGHDLVIWGAGTPELRQNCTTHRGSVLEFACRPCNARLCCYCVLLNHKDHDYHQLTELTDDDATRIADLVAEAKESLRYLKKTDKKINDYIKQNADSQTSHLDGEISRHFENFHAKLQTIERRLRDELDEHKRSKRKTLMSMREKVHENIAFINRACRYAKQLQSKDDVKYDTRYIIENLTLVSKTKCHLLRQEVNDDLEFEYGNAIDHIDDAYTIRCDDKNEFLLVKTEDLPEDYKLCDSYIADSSATQSNGTSLTNGDNVEDEAAQENIEKWLEGMSPNRASSVKSEHSLSSSDYASDKRSVNSQVLSSCVDESTTLEEQIGKTSKGSSVNYEHIFELESGNKHRVTVTHINSPSSFYVHPAKLTHVSMDLSKAIIAHSKRSSKQDEPRINEIYLVKFKSGTSTQWYRGRVTNIDRTMNKYTVFFLDYGNTSVVTRNWIKTIPAELLKTPPLAIECKIFDLWPVGTSWDKNSLSTMADIVNKESLLMVIVDKTASVCDVDLVTFDGCTSVREALMFSGYGVPTLTSNRLIAETKKEMASFTAKKEIHKFSRKFLENETANVIITYAENPFQIHLILVESQRVLSGMISAMSNFYKGARKGLVYSLEVGMYVAVSYALSATQTWFRATVVEVPETRGLVRVRLADVGPTVDVQWENVRRLDDQFYAAESLSFCVEMMDVEPLDAKSTWPGKVAEFFEPYVRDETALEMVVCSGQHPIAVVLFQNRELDKLCVNALLVSNGYGSAIGKYATDVNWKVKEDNPKFTTEMMKTTQSTNSIYDSCVDDYSGIQKEVEIVSAENPSLIYVKFVDVQRKYQELYREMQVCYTNCEFVPQNWSPKQPVVVRFEGVYLRGIVEEEVLPDVYKVSLKDILKQVEVKSGDMVSLHQCFIKCPERITRCHLANIVPAGGTDKWTAIACELLQETLKDKPKVFLTKCGKIDMTTRSLPVLLWYKQFIPGGALEQSKTILCSVNKILLKNGLALKAKVNQVLEKEYVSQESGEKKFWDWLPPVLITEEHILAIPTCVNDHGHIYIHDVRDNQALEEMSQELLKYFKNSTVDNKLEDWQVGDICIAKYFLDEQWYRAKVIGINKDSVRILMIDYGNEEDLQPCNLRKEILFENIPVFASVVHLQDINPLNGVWDTADLDILHGALVDKEIDVYFINGHDIHNPSLVSMSFKNISINEFILTQCKHLENSTEEDNSVHEDVNTSMAANSDSVILDFESDRESDVLILDDEKSENLSSNEIIKESPSNYQIEPLPCHETVQITIINLLNYNTVVFELTDYDNVNVDTFERMQREIQTQAPGLPNLENLQLHSPCIVKYAQDESYYRGKILGLRKRDVLVWFVDYGNFEFILNEEVREMQSQWLEYPIQHHIAEIDGISLVKDARENVIKEHLSSFYNTILLAKIVSQHPLKVRLYDEKTHKLIYQTFIDDGTLRLVET